MLSSLHKTFALALAVLLLILHCSMSRDQRHGRQLPRATSGITFNGVPLSPLTPGTAAVESDEDDVVIIDACNGKRKVGDAEEGRGSQGDDDVVDIHGGGGGGGDQASMFAERERDRRRRMNDMFADIRRLIPNLPEKSNKVEIVDGAIAYIKMLQGEEAKMEARKLELQRERDRLALEVAAGGGAGASSSAAAAVTVAAYGPVGGVASSSSAAAAAMAAAAARTNTVPQRARGATAPTPRPVAPQVGTWPLQAPATTPPPPAAAGGVGAAVDRRAAPPPSLKTWSWGDNVVVSVLGNIGNMTVRAPLRRTGVLAMASAALKRYNITAVTSLSGTDPSQTQNMFMFYTIIDMPDRKPQFVHPKVFEAMYRAAAAEIAAWINAY